MKDKLIFGLLVILVMALIFAFIFGIRYLNQAASPTHTFKPEDGITCVQVSSGDGVAISCVLK